MGYKALGVIFSLVFFFTIFGVSAQEAPQKKKWTFLIFLNADNNLEHFGYGDIQEMEKVGSTNDVNVVAEFDWEATPGTKRLYIEKNKRPYANSEDIHSKVVEEMPEQDMGDSEHFKDFVVWGMKNYPAENYLVLIWNHGSGWNKEGADDVMKGVSYDETSGNHITTNQLADALDKVVSETGNRISILAFDACLMAMAEIADSLTGMVDYLVSSEETIPGDGYAYDDWFSVSLSRPPEELLASTVAKDMVKTYGASYSGGSQGTHEVTLSAMDLSKFELLKRRLVRWQELVSTKAILGKKEFQDAADSADSFSTSEYRDLSSYMKNVLGKLTAGIPAAPSVAHLEVIDQSLSMDNGMIGATVDVIKAVDELVIENFASDRFKNSKGLSIELPGGYYGSSWNPNSYTRKKYMELKWAKDTNWADHLDFVFTPPPPPAPAPVPTPVPDPTPEPATQPTTVPVVLPQ